MGDDSSFTKLTDEIVNPLADLESTVLSIDENNDAGTGQIIQEITSNVEQGKCKTRIPKRILHFSDGTLEEFSSDEDDEAQCKADTVDANVLVNPAALTWAPYVWYQVTKLGSNTLAVCDYLGEHLANFFGITSPKYQFEVNEYFKMKAEEEEEKQKQDVEMRGWTEKSALALVTDCGGKETVEAVAQQPYASKDGKERTDLHAKKTIG